MLNKFVKYLYTFSAVSPLFIFTGIFLYMSDKNIIYLVILLLIIIYDAVYIFVFNKLISGISSYPVLVTSIENNENWWLPYITSIILPVLTYEYLDKLKYIYLVIVILISIFLLFNDSIFHNIFFKILKYNFYKVKLEGSNTEYLAISRVRLRNKEDIKNCKKVFELFIVLEVQDV